MSEGKGVKVKVENYHTFNGKEYQKGDTYTVHGDGSTTLEQYLDSLRVRQFAFPVGEEHQRVIDEVGAPDEQDDKKKAKPAEKKSDEDNDSDDRSAAKDDKKADKAADDDDKPKAPKSTAVAPMDTESMKAVAAEKTVEHRKPANQVPTVKK